VKALNGCGSDGCASNECDSYLVIRFHEAPVLVDEELFLQLVRKQKSLEVISRELQICCDRLSQDSGIGLGDNTSASFIRLPLSRNPALIASGFFYSPLDRRWRCDVKALLEMINIEQTTRG
jgi:hypothetical protein